LHFFLFFWLLSHFFFDAWCHFDESWPYVQYRRRAYLMKKTWPHHKLIKVIMNIMFQSTYKKHIYWKNAKPSQLQNRHNFQISICHFSTPHYLNARFKSLYMLQT
jgi:hypothetical protein